MCVFRPASYVDIDEIVDIINQAKDYMRQIKSSQWNKEYPNRTHILDDINNQSGYVITKNRIVVAYGSLSFTCDPCYASIDGKWLLEKPYAVIHRLAVAQAYKRQGVACQFIKYSEELCLKHGIHSVKIDTHFDNTAFQSLLEKLNFVYCGLVYISGVKFMAYEKLI